MQQTKIPGTEPADRNPEIDAAIDRVYEAKTDAKRASEVHAMAKDTLAARFVEAGIERYRYLDPATGRWKIMTIESIMRLRSEKEPSRKKAEQDAEFERGQQEHDEGQKEWAAEVERRKRGEKRKAKQ